MTARAPFTEAQIRRAIKAARKEGLPIAGVRPDGTVVIGEPSTAMVPDAANADEWAVENWKKPVRKKCR